jgi:hypothetical protein
MASTLREFFGKVNRYEGLLEEIEDPHGFGYADLRTVLEPLEDALVAISKRFDGLNHSATDPDELDWIQGIIDDEVGYIEELLGAAFAVSQRYLTHAISNTKRLHELLVASKQPAFKCTSDAKKGTLMKAGSPKVGSSGYSAVEVINATANLYKHRDEWPYRDWKQFTGQEKMTVDVLLAIGVRQHSTGHFRTCAEALGETKYANLAFLLEALCTWRFELAKMHRDELRQRKLVA